MSIKSILLRTGIRSDRIWCNPLLFREPFRRIPFYLDLYALNKSQYWSQEQLRQLRIERFAETVSHAAQIPFWKERFAQADIDPDSFKESDIARIPILSKKDFQDKDVREYTLETLLPKSTQYKTSGSTGQPFAFYHDPAFELRSSSISERTLRAAAHGERFPIILYKNSPDHGMDYVHHHFFFVQGYNSVQHRMPELQKLISSFPAGVVIYGLSSSLVELARVCRELSIVLPIQSAVTCGEGLKPSQRKEVKDSLKTRVCVTSGMVEVRRTGFECGEGRMHLNDESLFFEVTDDNGVPLPPGTEGKLVITGFENRVMPFIRYNTGDTAVIHEDQCPCGRTLRTFELHGRQAGFLHVGENRVVSLVDVSTILDSYPKSIRQFQIVRTGRSDFTIRIIWRDRSLIQYVKDDILNLFRLRVHPETNVAIEDTDLIAEGPNGKALYFIDYYKGTS